jgi:hypothetical protein
MNPALAKAYATVSRPVEKVAAEQPPYVVEYARLTRRVEAVTSVIDRYLI